MDKIAELITANGWTQVEAAAQCGLTQPRISDLLHGRISRFSLDALMNIAAALGQCVGVKLEAARDKSLNRLQRISHQQLITPPPRRVIMHCACDDEFVGLRLRDDFVEFGLNGSG